ncbi:rhamnose ABC transporter substrate-binding protein [Actinotalea sp. M2MS4P-6]|uniref:rhamnose ABC transporter substrate-binding protein n=1 Tax=Actinotalea sp. M2MS4P-6 TaxID=2983762 RepID=UPI0021E4DAE0|nr:rhamnose ABC transporter substrate-binding protein [Actinotalea sp. M2MS4P-6]MCV2395886.1 rhamnose ABC transporter substrate-binding protein [Actinotalea sp. M2MS4P-6]
MRLLRRRSVVAAGAVVALSLGLAACSSGGGGEESSSAGGDSGSSDSGSMSYDIAFLPKNLGNPYFDASDGAAKTAVEGFGGTFKEVGPTEAAPDAQVSFINTLTQQQVGAIVISANDPDALCDAIGQAQDAGVHVLTFDSDTNCREMYIAASNTELIGQKQVDIIAEEIGGSGQIAILSASANATNQNAWIDVMKAYLASDYPDIELVDVVYGDDDDQTSYDKTEALLSQYPDLKGIISPTTVGIAAAARYLSTSEYKGQVMLTGLGTPNDMRDYVKDGTVQEFALWNPEDLGILASWAAKALIDGSITGAEGDTFTAEGLSSDVTDFTVGADGIVVLGDPYVFNADNIDNFNF